MSSADVPGSDLTRKQRREQAREQRRALEEAAAAQAARRHRLYQLGGVLVAAAVVVGILIAVSSGGSKTKPVAVKPAASLFTGIPQSNLTLGNPKAPVTMEEFADLQCPYCREYTANVLPTLVARYVRSGQVQMVFRNLHFIGPDSYTAAQFAGAAGQQNRLWDFIDNFYANQQQENSGYVTDSFLQQVASQSGVNVASAETARNSPVVGQEINTADSLAQTNGIDSTPSFLIGRSGGPLHLLSYQDLTPGSFTGPIDQLLGKKG